MFAAIRGDSINLPLLVHVAGALVLVGSLVAAVGIALAGWREERALLSRLAYKVLLLVAFPAWIVMRIGAEWVYSKEHLDDLPSDPTWVGIGFTTADLGGILLLIALIVGGIGLRRTGQGR